jgi:hypothetical protein
MKQISNTTVNASTSLVIDVADYTDAAIRAVGVWNGTLSFTGSVLGSEYVALGVQSFGATDLTAAVTSLANSSSFSSNAFRVNVAGLKEIKFSLGPSDTGSVGIAVNLISTSNAR